MSEFWVRKMRTYFGFLDVDKSGTLNKHDIMLFGDRFFEKENPDAERQKKIRTGLENWWKGLTTAIGSDENTVFTEPEFIKAIKTQQNNPQFLANMRHIYLNFFEALDANGDGFLQEDEYKRCWESAGLRNFHEPASISFHAIDTNRDGKLSVQEIGDAAADFVSCEDEENPSKLLHGPLI